MGQWQKKHRTGLKLFQREEHIHTISKVIVKMMLQQLALHRI